MNKEDTEEAIKVMQAWADGETIEFASRGCNNDYWVESATACFSWNWVACRYRIAKPKPVELKVGMVLITDNIENQERVVQAIYGEHVCYIHRGGLFVNNYTNVHEEFSVLSKGKLHPIILPESF